MKKLFLILFIYSCSSNCEPTFPDMEDAIDDICKPTDGYLLRRNMDKTYILTGAEDNLSSTDIAMFDIGLYCLGYQPVVVEPFVYFDEMKELIQQPVDLFYFSGHGTNAGTVKTSDHVFNAQAMNVRYVATNIFLNACIVLENDTVIFNEITEDVKYVMGYTYVSYDNEDNKIALNMLKEMKKGNSIPMSFYLANIKNDDLKDRWCIYQNSPEGLIEYSARSGNKFVE